MTQHFYHLVLVGNRRKMHSMICCMKELQHKLVECTIHVDSDVHMVMKVN